MGLLPSEVVSNNGVILCTNSFARSTVSECSCRASADAAERDRERERETERGGRESMAEKQTRSDLKKNMQAQASSRHENGDEA